MKQVLKICKLYNKQSKYDKLFCANFSLYNSKRCWFAGRLAFLNRNLNLNRSQADY